MMDLMQFVRWVILWLPLLLLCVSVLVFAWSGPAHSRAVSDSLAIVLMEGDDAC